MSKFPFAFKRQVPKALGAASCSTDITCGKGDLCDIRMAVASSVLPETPGASPVNVKRVSAYLHCENWTCTE